LIIIKIQTIQQNNSLTVNGIAIISAGYSIKAPLIEKRWSYNSMIEYVTIRKLKG
jgi:hypothetical protein